MTRACPAFRSISYSVPSRPKRTVPSAAAEFADTEAHMALHRPLTPDDTAAVVAMLARDEAGTLTGQTLTADGGLVMR
jgi:NAD(P)-dependent dehydrogenase (short-subunit alcohol dehydrogenase family)